MSHLRQNSNRKLELTNLDLLTLLHKKLQFLMTCVSLGRTYL